MLIFNTRDYLTRSLPVLSAGLTPERTVRVECLSGSALSPHALRSLSRELLGVYVDGFMHSQQEVAERQDEFTEDLQSHLASAERILVVRAGDSTGFLCSTTTEVDGITVYYLGGIILAPELQRKRLGFSLLSYELLETRANILAFDTQSRRMLGLGQQCAEITLEASQAIAQRLGKCGPMFELQSCTTRSRYGGRPLYGDPIRLREIALPGIDVDAGDARFFAGFVKTRQGDR